MGDTVSMNDSADRRLGELRRLLELEITKLRHEASAETLRARAAELEIKLRKLAGKPTDSAQANAVEIEAGQFEPSRMEPSHIEPSHIEPSHIEPRHIEPGGAGTEQFRTPQSGPDDSGSAATAPSKLAPPAAFAGWGDVASTMGVEINSGSPTLPAPTDRRFDRPSLTISKPKMDRLVESVEDGSVEDGPGERLSGERLSGERLSGERLSGKSTSEEKPSPKKRLGKTAAFNAPAGVASKDDAEVGSTFDLQQARAVPAAIVTPLVLDKDDSESPKARRRPMAMVVSALVHGLLLFGLTLVGFQTQRPKDQIAITSAAAETSEVAMETFEMETDVAQEQPVEQSQPIAAEFEAELSPVGTEAIGIPDLKTPPAFNPPTASLASLKSTAALSKLTSQTPAKMEFCGVEGGGNHFVYVIDSSKSIGDSFKSARSELIRSIELLKPDQRFYVICYDAKIEYMRIRNPGVDELTSVRATDENKAALRRWALTITQEVGKGGDAAEAMSFALDLRPDVIFLLSDGEFPEKVETILREQNKIENLFDEPRPIAIVHTICYHSRAGESRMKRVASQNGGQYRYVPK